jgi:hypothetical protein
MTKKASKKTGATRAAKKTAAKKKTTAKRCKSRPPEPGRGGPPCRKKK